MFFELRPNDLNIAILNWLALRKENNEFFNPIPAIKIADAEIIDKKYIKFSKFFFKF